MIWILLTIACAYASIVLLAGAFVHARSPAGLTLPLPRVRISAHPVSNENATRRFVAIDAIAACRDSVSRAATRRARASFIEAAIHAQRLDPDQRGSVA